MVISQLFQTYITPLSYLYRLSLVDGELKSVIVFFYFLIAIRFSLNISSCRLAHCIERYGPLDLVPLPDHRLFIGFRDDLVPTPDIVTFEADKCSAVWTEMLIVSETPFLGTWKNGDEAAAPEAERKEDEAHDPRQLARRLGYLSRA